VIGNASKAGRGLSLLSFLPLRERPLLVGNFDDSMQLVGILVSIMRNSFEITVYFIPRNSEMPYC